MSKKKSHKTYIPEEEVITPVAEDDPVVVEETPDFVTGVVVGCTKLNVREQMHTGATVLCELPVSSEVRIIADEHHDAWYHVFTASGVEGFCMKKYIAVEF